MMGISRAEIKAMRNLTMACWWPSRITGVTIPDWEGIEGELAALTGGAERRLESGSSSLTELHNLRKLRQLAKDRLREVSQRSVGKDDGRRSSDGNSQRTQVVSWARLRDQPTRQPLR